MSRFSLSLLLFFAYSFCYSQAFQTGTQRLLFDPTLETDTLDKGLFVINPKDYPITISEIRFYDTYNTSGFSADIDTFTLGAGAFKRIEVFFHPKQNVNYNSELVLITENGLGAIAVDLEGQGTFSNSYYSSTQNLSEQALKDALKSRLSNGQLTLSYNDARNFMFESIDNQRLNGQGASVNTLECVYTGTVITGYANRSAAQNMGFNTEHTFPQSLFSQNLPMRSDLFHLFPTTATSNSVRSNLPFGNVSNPSWQQGGSSSNGSSFEARDVHKGRVARAMFYFVIRYSNYSNYLNSQEALLRQWHEDFLPTQIDSRRNEDIFARQKNRNPFIDYPQFIHRISSISGNSVASDKSLDLIYNEVVFPETPLDSTPVFSYLMVNKGRLPVSLSGFSSSNPDFRVSQADTTLEVGDALSVKVELMGNNVGLTTGELTFQTDVSGLANVTVPLSANLLATDLEKLGPLSRDYFVHINEAKKLLVLGTETPWENDGQWKLFDLGGREQAVYLLKKNERRMELDIRNLKKGIYVLQIEGRESKKVVIK